MNIHKVTLLISTYNWPEALRALLESVLGQTIMPDEVVIADDGSTEETKNVIDEFRGRLSKPIVHVWHEDKGFRLSQIRNKGIAKSSGDYIIQIDGDVILSKNFIEDHLDVARKGCFVCGSRISLSEKSSKRILCGGKWGFCLCNGNISLSNFFNRIRLKFVRHLLADRYAKRIESHIRGCNMAYWRSDIIRVNGYDESYINWGYEDWDLAYRLHFAGIKKRSLKHGGIMYHLWHNENSKNKETNYQLFNQTVNEKRTSCGRGIDKYISSNL